MEDHWKRKEQDHCTLHGKHLMELDSGSSKHQAIELGRHLRYAKKHHIGKLVGSEKTKTRFYGKPKLHFLYLLSIFVRQLL